MDTVQNMDAFRLRGAIRSRRRHIPFRSVSVLATALVLSLAFGWWWLAWSWVALFAVAQALEMIMSPRVVRNPPRTALAAYGVAVLLFTPCSIIYGALAPFIWLGIDRFGPMIGLAMVGFSLANAIINSNGSRPAALAAGLPYIVYLFAMPILDASTWTPTLMTSMLVAFGVVCLNALGAWTVTRRSYLAETAALQEAQTRRAEAEAAIEAKSAFVAMISHELRTPISAILAGAAEVEKDGGPRAQQGQMIAGAGRMMRMLLNDMLDLSRLEAGRMAVESIPFDLRAVLLDAMRLWRPQAREKGLRLRIEGVHRAPRWVQGDPTRLAQVLNNLFSNAIKFTETGAITLKIGMAGDRNGQAGLALTVSDTGAGMTAEQLQRLFTPFEQLGVSTARKHGGSGLGLAISRELARLMGGELTVTASASGGAAFTLIAPVPAAMPPEVSRTPEAAVEARVLVVDDHVVNRQALILLLAQVGVSPETAASAEEALTLLAAEPYDLVLMDVYMPGMDGRQATRVLRASTGPNQMTPVIAITASDTIRDWEACCEAGMNGHVAKPIEPAQLYSALRRALEPAGGVAAAA